ncbi:caspase, EACC1-associated type [Glycomyces albidus]|uniref:Hsp70 family protein n=1 Tax=Glycomyces albidus TaxID=2656774 RepID=A0A6L5G799_9ACTN|nr:Hsp70 family protein [Glycomyces albidus]MQM25522.1 Hsp70 family protein [Glycomyces albidus]
MAKRALIIANGTYDDEHFSTLPAAAADAAALEAVLADPAIGGFEVTSLVDVSQRAAMRSLEGFFASAGPDDLLLLHLSVHGWKDLYNRLHFVMRDTERAYPGATAIAAEMVSDWMTRSRSKRIVVTLDCCYSGAFVVGGARRSTTTPEVDVTEPMNGSGRAVITASTSLQYAHESDEQIRSSRNAASPSVFTKAFVNGLGDGSADRDGDGRISVHELFQHIHEQVKEAVEGQTPTLSVDNIQGVLYLARNPRQGRRRSEADAGAAHDANVWRRVGALFALETELGSVHEDKRERAEAALLRFMEDPDPQIADRARALWHERGLGEIPGPRRAQGGHGSRQRAADKIAVGIDFGTTNSSVAYYDGEDARIIPNREGYRSTPSLVAIAGDGSVLVGNPALRQMIANPDYTARSVKLKLGTGWSIERGGVELNARKATELILAQLHRDTEDYFGHEVKNAIVTVPTDFDRVQQLELVEAASEAGWEVMRLYNEPTAAVMALGMRQDLERTVLVFDLGGGTLDVTLAEIGDGVVEVKATTGDGGLGGDDWDRWLVAHFRGLARSEGVDLPANAEVAQRLWEAAEKAKIELSSAASARVLLPYLATGPAGPYHFDRTVTRSEFERGTLGLLDRCRRPVQRALDDAGIEPGVIDQVILTGGASRMPALEPMVRSVTGSPKVYRGLIPEGIATGAALVAGTLLGSYKDGLLLDTNLAGVGVLLHYGVLKPVLAEHTIVPTKVSSYVTTIEDGQPTAALLFVEGDLKGPAENARPLALLELTGLVPRPQGVPLIEVSVDIDANKHLHLTATELDSASDGGPPNEVHASVDRRTIERAEAYLRSHGGLRNAPGAVASAPAPEHRPPAR